MPQLQINQGPQDALLYDNSRSYFTNVGYVRTSNFQVEYRKVDSQNTANWGTTVTYVIPKAADLLGPVDLRVEIPVPTDSGIAGGNATDGTCLYTQWVDELGFAMIDKITFAVGSNDIETLTGEQLQLRNELMTSDEMRMGFGTIQKTGRSAFSKTPTIGEFPGTDEDKVSAVGGRRVVNKDYTRLIGVKHYCGLTDGAGSTINPAARAGTSGKRNLIIPLGLFFTKHVSQYFPLAAVAGCNDIRISIKLRPLNELLQMGGVIAGETNVGGDGSTAKISPPSFGPPVCELLCHYVHVTGPEAQTLMNKEHVRLLKLYQHQTYDFEKVKDTWDINLSFLHPVSTLIITIRARNDMSSKLVAATTGSATASSATDISAQTDGADAEGKGFFFYHGDGTNPNYDRNVPGQSQAQGTVKVDSISLALNGQERHPGLSKGLDIEYLRQRLLPMLHSNSSMKERQLMAGADVGEKSGSYGPQTYGLEGSKNIMVYPFSLNPEGSNPSGAVNFSKVSHAKLTLHMDTTSISDHGVTHSPLHLSSEGKPNKCDDGFRVDVYALYYNWLQIKDGRALLSFA